MIAKPAPDPKGWDERAAERYPCEVPTTCQPPSSWRKDPWPAVIRNIATDGLSLRLYRRFERDSGLAIELPTEDGGTTTVLARVVYIEPAEGGAWVLGCRFISELSDEEVRLVLGLDPHRQPPRADSALSRRPSLNGVVFQTRLRGEVVRWYVKRLDLGGTWPLPDDKVVSFRVGAADSDLVEMTIKKCRRIGSYWIIDCKFRQDVPDAVLRAITAPAGG